MPLRTSPLSAPCNDPRVLIVDADRKLADDAAALLETNQLRVQIVHAAEDALRVLEGQDFELVISDVKLPGMMGLELLRIVRERWPMTKVVLVSSEGSVTAAVEAMRSGACDYLTKPFGDEELVFAAKRAVAPRGAAGSFDLSAIVGDVAAALAADDTLQGLKSALRVLLHATGADDGEVFLCEPDGRDPLLCATAGPDDGALSDRTRFQAGVGYPGIVVATGKPICRQGNLADDPRYLRRSVVDVGIRSFVAAPLPDVRGALGSIHLMSRRDDFPVERVLELLERAAVPIGSAIRAGLAALRQSVDAICGDLDDTSRQLRVVLESMRQVAGAQYGTLALIDPATGRPSQVVSTGPASLVCSHAEAGSLSSCPSTMASHGFAAKPGRREWPEACRCGLPRRANSPSCLPLVANGHLHGLVVLDFGRDRPSAGDARLIPLLCMASQLAIRLQSRNAGLNIQPEREESELVHITSSTSSTTTELELRCFGTFSVLRRGQPISAESFTRGKALVLLKLLALNAGAPLNRDVLIERLWPEVEPRLGANRLHGVVHDLRSVIEPNRTAREWTYVRNRGELYYLDTSAPIDIDVARFRSLISRGVRADEEKSPEAITLLEQAVDVYRGDLFADDPFAEWCEIERRELKDCFVNALERLARLHREQGGADKAMACWRRALRSSPFREDLLIAQMGLLKELGRPREALMSYEEHRRLLTEELDAEPSWELKALHRRLLSAERGASQETPDDPPRKRATGAARVVRP